MQFLRKRGEVREHTMTRLNGLISKMFGSAGNLNFRRREGITIVSEKVTEVKNPRTSAQQQIRMKWGNKMKEGPGISLSNTLTFIKSTPPRPYTHPPLHQNNDAKEGGLMEQAL